MSAILSADDLNDFISPGIACIKPVETLPAAKAGGSANPYEVTTEDETPHSNLSPAQISLTDCLACSGCVTSAEAVLVSLQSHSEVLQALDSGPAIELGGDSLGINNAAKIAGLQSGGRVYVASISPQTRASIAATYRVSERVAGNMIQQLLSGPQGLRSGGKYRNGFEWVVDTNSAREACLVLGAEEVMTTLQNSALKHNLPGRVSTQPKTPILTSSCPGWICYAEKTHPHVLPHLSRLKSPQALMGTLLKTVLSKKLRVLPGNVWHVAVMPCFDKKLEASREELSNSSWGESQEQRHGVRDVDCVITSKELLMLADSRGISFGELPHTSIDPAQRRPFPDPEIDKFLSSPSQQPNRNHNPAAGTSGGNLYYALQLCSSRNSGSSIQSVRGRNSDIVEYTVTSASGETILRAARYYGFRNIQNLVRRLKPAKVSRIPGGRFSGSAKLPGGKSPGPEYAFMEVMACPGGCTNGGGQIKSDDIIISRQGEREPCGQKEWLAMVDEAYFSDEDSTFDPMDKSLDTCDWNDLVGGISSSYIQKVLAHWSSVVDISLDRLAYTSYRPVVSDIGKNKVALPERVIEIAGKVDGGW